MSDPDLTPDQDDAVRALLASVRHTGPTPPDVVARLDATLASLAAERDEERAPVVTLASRRRRAAASALLAAAAVVVVGVGITQVLPDRSGSDDSAGSAAEAPAATQPDRGEGAGSELDEQSLRSSGTDEKQDLRDPATPESAPSASTLAEAPVLTSAGDLRTQVRAALRDQSPSAFAATPLCGLPAAADQGGTIVAVTFDGEPGALVVGTPTGGTQAVDLFVCDEPVAVRSLQLRAP